jgi:hypothetical protein
MSDDEDHGDRREPRARSRSASPPPRRERSPPIARDKCATRPHCAVFAAQQRWLRVLRVRVSYAPCAPSSARAIGMRVLPPLRSCGGSARQAPTLKRRMLFVPLRRERTAYGAHGYAALTVPVCVHPMRRQVAASRGCAAEAQPQPLAAPPS